MLSDIEVLDGPDDTCWMKTAYTIADTPHASIKPGETDVKMAPINRMVPRSFFTSVKSGDTLSVGAPTVVRGIAFGGDAGVARVDCSGDGGRTWQSAGLGNDEGSYSFRRWQADFTPPARGNYTLMVRCTNSKGVVRPDQPNWNPGGFLRNVIETASVTAACGGLAHAPQDTTARRWNRRHVDLGWAAWALRRAILGTSWRVPSARLLPPDVEGFGPGRTIGRGCRSVAAWMEMAVYERVSREEMLRLVGRFEPLHLPFSAARRSI